MNYSQQFLDEFDIRILDQLQKDAWQSSEQLAESVGLSKTPCWRRVQRMRKSGVILGYRTLIDPEKVGLGVSVFISVTLEKKTRTAVDEFEIAVKKIPEITECYEISGRADYLLRVVVRDIKEYRDFLMDRLMRIAGVRDVESSFLLETVKENCGLPIRPMGLSTTGDAV